MQAHPLNYALIQEEAFWDRKQGYWNRKQATGTGNRTTGKGNRTTGKGNRTTGTGNRTTGTGNRATSHWLFLLEEIKHLLDRCLTSVLYTVGIHTHTQSDQCVVYCRDTHTHSLTSVLCTVGIHTVCCVL